MRELRIECPHCGSSFEVQIDGEISNMMVFPCASCKAPLMYFHGEVTELDREEFKSLRNRLSRVIDVALKQGGLPNEAAQTLKNIVDESNARAEERERVAKSTVSAASEVPSISDESLEQLQHDLAELDVDSFLDKL